MGIFPTTLQDILRTLAQTFHAAAIFPAAIWVLLNTYVVIPLLNRDLPDSPWWAPASFGTMIIFSYLLYTLNGPLIRLAEGYAFEWTPIGQWRKGKWQKEYDALNRKIEECEDQLDLLVAVRDEFLDDHPGRSRAEYEADPTFYYILRRMEQWSSWKRTLDRRKLFYFPSEREDVIPTGLGNIVAAFEGYPYYRYRMDSIYMWPRLTPILQAEGYAAFVQQEKGAFDFMLNLGYVCLLIGAELIFVFMLKSEYVAALLTLPLTAGIAYAFYRASHSAAIHWGGRFKVAFDLYRERLREALGVRKPVSLDDERKLWGKLSKFYREADARFEEFDYYRQSVPLVLGDKTSVQVSKVVVEEDRDKTRYALIIRNTTDGVIEQVEVIDFVESNHQPRDITASDPQSKLTHCRLDDWANAYQWSLASIAGGATIILTYSLDRPKAESIQQASTAVFT